MVDFWAMYAKLTSDDVHHPLSVPVRAVVRWSTVFYRQLSADRAFVRAAAMAYTTLIAFVPMLLLVFGILSATGVLQQDRETIESILFDTFVGDIPGIREFLMPGLLQVDLRALSLLGIGGLLFIAARLFLMVERAYNDIFGVPMRRKLRYRLLNFYFTMTAVPVLSGVVVIGMADAMGDAFSQWSFLAIEGGLTFALLVMGIRLFPCTYVRWGPALLGATVSTVLLSLSRVGFHYYLLWFRADDPLTVVYGSVGLIPIFLLWLYLVWVVVLLGVEVASVAQNFDSLMAAEQEQREKSERVLIALGLESALSCLYCVGRAHVMGAQPANSRDIAEECGLSLKAAHEVLEVLREQRWIVQADETWVLACAPSRIALKDVVQVWMRETSPRRGSRDTPVQRLLDDALAKQLSGTLEEGLKEWMQASAKEAT